MAAVRSWRLMHAPRRLVFHRRQGQHRWEMPVYTPPDQLLQLQSDHMSCCWTTVEESSRGNDRSRRPSHPTSCRWHTP